MDCQEILSHIDHTLLKPTATWADIQALCQEAVTCRTATVCIPASYLEQARAAFPGLALCTVIGFPLGYTTTQAKCAEAADAVIKGADEVDMVVNLGWVKDGLFDQVTREIAAVKAACGGRPLKVIVETCYLTREEKIALCGCVTLPGAHRPRGQHQGRRRRQDRGRSGGLPGGRLQPHRHQFGGEAAHRRPGGYILTR